MKKHEWKMYKKQNMKKHVLIYEEKVVLFHVLSLYTIAKPDLMHKLWINILQLNANIICYYEKLLCAFTSVEILKHST